MKKKEKKEIFFVRGDSNCFGHYFQDSFCYNACGLSTPDVLDAKRFSSKKEAKAYKKKKEGEIKVYKVTIVVTSV